MRDFSGEVLLYGILNFQQKGLKVGDIITIIGKRTAYQGTPQVGSAVLEDEKVIPVTEATIAEVLAKPDSGTDYYKVTGEITEIETGDFGNLYFKDGANVIYVRGCYPGYDATGDFRKGLIAAKGIKVDDELTVIATKGSFNGVAQLPNGIYFSHKSGD